MVDHSINHPIQTAQQGTSRHPKQSLPKRYILGHFERFSLEKQAIEVDVNGVSVPDVAEDIFAVSVSEPDDEADHGHDRRRPRVVRASAVPLRRLGEGAWKMAVEYRGSESFEQFVEELLPVIAGLKMRSRRI